MAKKNKTVFYHPEPGINNLGNLYIPMEKSTNSPVKNTGIGKCPAWNHQNSRMFIHRASSNLKFHYDIETEKLFSNVNLDIFGNFILPMPPPNENSPLVFELEKIYSNFYWTEDEDVWISVIPHPLTSINNNFYHCGAQFNLSNWSRSVNMGIVVVDSNKEISIQRGDPLYIVKFHSTDQNQEFDLVYREPPEHRYEQSENKINFVRSTLGEGFDYNKILFESSSPEKKSKCPFSFLWNK
jgi:hypothetical protein